MLQLLRCALLFIIYNTAQIILLPVIIAFILYKEAKRKRTFFIPARWGFVKRATQPNSLWVHGASVGESLAVEYFLRLYKEKNPTTATYMTVGTFEGFRQASVLGLAQTVERGVYDFLLPILLAFSRIRPKTIIILESELWPNLVIVAKIWGAKLILLNARASKNTRKKSSLSRFFYKVILDCFDHIYTQTESDTVEFNEILKNSGAITTFGNIKTWNVVQKKKSSIAPYATSPLIILVGSAHEGELAAHIKLFASVKKVFGCAKLLFMPRHFSWLKEAQQRFSQEGFSFTTWDTSNQITHIGRMLNQDFETNDIIIVARIGLMFDMYQYAKLFILGGTFVPVGGHNLMEPLVWEVPTIVGPFHQNVAQTVNDLNGVGVFVTHNEEELCSTAKELLTNNAKITASQEAQRTWLQTKNHILEQTIARLIQQV